MNMLTIKMFIIMNEIIFKLFILLFTMLNKKILQSLMISDYIIRDRLTVLTQ